MSFDGNTPTQGSGSLRARLKARRRRRREGKPRIKKLRLLSILFGLSILAVVSTVFGMMMAVASDLPNLENREQYKDNKNNSVLLDYRGRRLGILQNNNNVVLVSFRQIAPAMQHAIIAIEDKRFYQNNGFDLQGIARAVVQDVTRGGAVQGASTITQQFVKNALEAQNDRTLFNKLKEAALAYHLTKQWPKEKILTEYLNQIYFGNGAHGIESAARVYFGSRHGYGQPGGCGATRRNMCASQLTTPEAALIAAVVASPSAYDPVVNPRNARMRRDIVLRYMRDQGYITASEYARDIEDPLPTQGDLTPPQETSASPYFTSWVRQQIVNHYGAFRAFNGGLRITTSLDLDLQNAAEQTISEMLPAGSGLPEASLVAIDNKTGEVRAMVGGPDYATRPFNLATQGQRQPGSTFKPFTLVTALEQGISPDNVYSSQPKEFPVPGTNGKEAFIVRNYGDAYSGSSSLRSATANSDNSVYAEVGIQVGTRKIARTARKLGIRTPISTNLAMTLGGLREGVTPLDMAHAYETIATGGKRIWNPELGAPDRGPIGVHKVVDSSGKVVDDNVRSLREKQVIDPTIAAETRSIMEGVVAYGSGVKAQVSGTIVAGKTGTTENYGDAWFVGWNDQLTIAIWVGYPDRLVPMLTQYGGEPVAGGTYPAQLFHNFLTSALGIYEQRRLADEARKNGDDSVDTTSTTPGELYSGPDTSSSDASGDSAPSTDGTDTTGGTTGGTGGDTGTGGGDTGTGGGTTGGGTTGAGGGGDTGAGGGTDTPVTPAPDTGGGGGTGAGGGTDTPAAPPPDTGAGGGGDTGGAGAEGGGAGVPTG
ncbi:transglycosylase domain-containing protein [Conexibacter sp. JD483]|uniref:transglycosylase domain-containing protein n=1 Tax=unclassified Conexibacter TaxID=2627773 RepID=UPI0027166E63|nr:MULTISPECIES: transglycosylase domain-containing protein [unclassified Conexibacter]MDO8185788.1 transglycosylase domain-containing protein [Conexibacter sp. CPCC 205706]MDO8199165.1 transglycosylase domain-containing protein [Conexibacter sp. CPCC 205762]MDR9369890.1 transglycosylase domain-containing protein [Conexibacter sp. JD483]